MSAAKLIVASVNPPTKEGPLSADLTAFQDGLAVNITSAYAAASLAVKLNPKVAFFYTGNVTNETQLKGFLAQGIGKTSAAYFIKAAAESDEYPHAR